jgi:hypothetical protein
VSRTFWLPKPDFHHQVTKAQSRVVLIEMNLCSSVSICGQNWCLCVLVVKQVRVVRVVRGSMPAMSAAAATIKTAAVMTA